MLLMLQVTAFFNIACREAGCGMMEGDPIIGTWLSEEKALSLPHKYCEWRHMQICDDAKAGLFNVVHEIATDWVWSMGGTLGWSQVSVWILGVPHSGGFHWECTTGDVPQGNVGNVPQGMWGMYDTLESYAMLFSVPHTMLLAGDHPSSSPQWHCNAGAQGTNKTAILFACVGLHA